MKQKNGLQSVNVY